jgi:hypothetical protein
MNINDRFKLKEFMKKQRIFVFGSNRIGHHGAGAAREAIELWGAVYGQADGRQGNSYAIVTTELRPDEDPVTEIELRLNLERFCKYAKRHPELEFYVTPVGTGLAGFTREQVLPVLEALAPSNCILTWKDSRYSKLANTPPEPDGKTRNGKRFQLEPKPYSNKRTQDVDTSVG